MTESKPLEQDPLSMPAGGLKEPEFPVLKEGIYRMQIRSFETAQSEKDGKTSERISIKLATTKDAMDTEDRKVHPGFIFTHAVFLTPGDNQTPMQIAEQAAMPVKAALGPKTKVSVRECLNNPSLIVDKIVDVKVGVRKGKGEYEGTFSNKVSAWVIPS